MALYDTAADASIVSQDFANNCGLPINKGSPVTFQLPSGKEWTLETFIQSGDYTFLVVPNSRFEAVFGRDILREHTLASIDLMYEEPKKRKLTNQQLNSRSDHYPNRVVDYLKMMKRVNNIAAVNSVQPFITAYVNGKSVVALFDSGASISYCQESTKRELALMEEKYAHLPRARAANSTEIRFLCKCVVTLKMGAFAGQCALLVTKDEHCPAPLLLGTDVMEQINKKKLVVQLNVAKREVIIGRQRLPMLIAGVIDDADTTLTLTADEDVCIPSRPDNIMAIKAPQSLISKLEYVVSESCPVDNIMIGRSVVQPGPRRLIHVPILNPTSAEI